MSARNCARDRLADIAGGRLSRCLLPWIPLMHGGGDPAIIEEWKALTAAEPDERLRANYAGLALVFAELTPGLPEWERAMEDWNVRRSKHVMQWQAEIRRDDVLRLLRLRFQTEVPTDLAESIQATTDMTELARWFDAAAVTPSLDAFRNAVQKNGH